MMPKKKIATLLMATIMGISSIGTIQPVQASVHPDTEILAVRTRDEVVSSLRALIKEELPTLQARGDASDMPLSRFDEMDIEQRITHFEFLLTSASDVYAEIITEEYQEAMAHFRSNDALVLQDRLSRPSFSMPEIDYMMRNANYFNTILRVNMERMDIEASNVTIGKPISIWVTGAADDRMLFPVVNDGIIVALIEYIAPALGEDSPSFVIGPFFASALNALDTSVPYKLVQVSSDPTQAGLESIVAIAEDRVVTLFDSPIGDGHDSELERLLFYT